MDGQKSSQRKEQSVHVESAVVRAAELTVRWIATDRVFCAWYHCVAVGAIPPWFECVDRRHKPFLLQITNGISNSQSKTLRMQVAHHTYIDAPHIASADSEERLLALLLPVHRA